MTSKDLEVFDFRGSQVRVIMQGQDPWWIARDVCHVLGMADTRSLRYLDADEKQQVSPTLLTEEPGHGLQSLMIVNEPGLYSLILRSRKPEAHEFKRWITHEVLPAIRRTGSYGDVALTPAALQEAVTLGVTSAISAVMDLVKPAAEMEAVLANPDVSSVTRRGDGSIRIYRRRSTFPSDPWNGKAVKPKRYIVCESSGGALGLWEPPGELEVGQIFVGPLRTRAGKQFPARTWKVVEEKDYNNKFRRGMHWFAVDMESA